MMEDQQLPDLLVVKGRETVKELVRRGMVEDLTTVYEECTTERIKEMYQSYGEALLESATFDGRLYALPDAEADHGASFVAAQGLDGTVGTFRSCNAGGRDGDYPAVCES